MRGFRVCLAAVSWVFSPGFVYMCGRAGAVGERLWVVGLCLVPGCPVYLACFSPCHYCLEIGGGCVGGLGGHARFCWRCESGKWNTRVGVGYKILRWCVSDSEWGCGGVG